MKKDQQYIEFIKAKRAGDTAKILQLINKGFNPSPSELKQLLVENDEVYATFYNHSLIIILDTSDTIGHLYIANLPIRDAHTLEIKVGYYGLNPKEEKTLKSLEFSAPAEIQNEEGRLRTKEVSVASIPIPLTEEQWQQLADWVLKIKNEKPKYFLLSHFFPIHNQFNCIKFVEKVLNEIGYNRKLKDLFDASELASLGFGLVKSKFYLPFGPTPTKLDWINICMAEFDSSSQVCTQEFDKVRSDLERQYNKNSIKIFFKKYASNSLDIQKPRLPSQEELNKNSYFLTNESVPLQEFAPLQETNSNLETAFLSLEEEQQFESSKEFANMPIKIKEVKGRNNNEAKPFEYPQQFESLHKAILKYRQNITTLALTNRSMRAEPSEATFPSRGDRACPLTYLDKATGRWVATLCASPLKNRRD